MNDPAWLTRLEKATGRGGHQMSGFVANEIAKEFREQQAEIQGLKLGLDESSKEAIRLRQCLESRQKEVFEQQAEVERVWERIEELERLLPRLRVDKREAREEIERLRKLAKKLYECTTLQGDVGWEVACGYRIDNPWLEEE